jgi:glutamine synthetase
VSAADLVGGLGLWTEEQERAAARLAEEVEKGRVEVVRFVFADQHGVLRGKALVGRHALKAMRRGVTMTTTLVAKDTSHRTVFPVFTAGGGFDMPEMQGAADMLMIPDPSTWRILPWARNQAWVLCDLHYLDGKPVPFCARRLARRALAGLDALDCVFTAGLEVEFHLFRVDDRTISQDQSGQPGAPPEFGLLSTGAQYLTEITYDAVEPIMEIIRRDILELGLPLASMEVEFGPSQFEFTFAPTTGLETCDNMALFRTAMKAIARRNGLHATFMCRPKMPNAASSGWHLHQSLTARDGSNLFMPEPGEGDLSKVGRHYLGGLLEHGRGSAIFAAPTINAYKRYRPYSLAPDRVVWAKNNRGAMLRVIGGPGDPATRVENRIGEPSANPYLYVASQVVAGLDGVRRQLHPGPGADAPYESERPGLPLTLASAIDALRADRILVGGMGEEFVDYYCAIKQAEIRRFEQEVSEWEHREYFDLF